MFILSVAIGVGQGLQPVAAFNYGAKKYRRVRQAAIFTPWITQETTIAVVGYFRIFLFEKITLRGEQN